MSRSTISCLRPEFWTTYFGRQCPSWNIVPAAAFGRHASLASTFLVLLGAAAALVALARRLAFAGAELTASPYDEEFQFSLPRDEDRMDGHNFTIERLEPDGAVIISDGERRAAYIDEKTMV